MSSKWITNGLKRIAVTVLVPLMAWPSQVQAASVVTERFANISGKGFYREILSDLEVKVPGGRLFIERNWINQQWVLDSSWAPLQIAAGTLTKNATDFTPAQTTSCAPGGVCTTQLSSSSYANLDATETIRVNASGYVWSDSLGNSIAYDKDGCITSGSNANNVKITFSYAAAQPPANSGVQGFLCSRASGLARMTAVADHFGQTMVTFLYDPATSDLTGVQDYSGRRVTYGYSGGKLTQVTDPSGNAWKYGYDAGGNLTAKTDPNGVTQTLAYDGVNRLTSITNADGTTRTLSYNFISGASQNYIAEKKEGGEIYEYYLSLDGVVQRLDVSGATIYTSQGAVDSGYSRTYFNGTTTYVSVDKFGHATQIVTGDGKQTTYQYEPTHQQLARVVHPDHTEDHFVYDSSGNLKQKVLQYGKASQTVTTFTYDQYGNMTGKTFPDGTTMSYTYDQAGNPASIVDPSGKAIQLTWNVLGQLQTLTNARGKVWQTTFDAAGNFLAVTDPLGGSRRFTYDKAGNQLSEEDPAGNVNAFAYDSRNRLVSFTDGAGGAYHYTRDAGGRVAQLTDPQGNSQTFSYDSSGRPTSFVDDLGNNVLLKYPAAGEAGGAHFGQPSTIVWPGFQIAEQFDGAGRIVGSTYSDALGASLSTSFRYDGNGHFAGLTTPGGTSFRLVSSPYGGSLSSGGAAFFQGVEEGAALNEFVGWLNGVSRDFLSSGRPKLPHSGGVRPLDRFGRRLLSPLVDKEGNIDYRRGIDSDPLQNFEPYSDGRAEKFGGGPSSLTDGAGATTQFRYDKARNLISVADANGNLTTNTYDANGRLLSEQLPLGQKTTYTYDIAANSITTTDARGRTTVITYSDGGRPVSIQRPSDAAASSVTLTYDPNGRLTGWNDGTMSESYTWDGAGRKLSQTMSYGGFSLGSQYGYYANGLRRTLTGPDGITYNYVYDASNQPARIDLPGVGSIGFQDPHAGFPAEIDFPGGAKLLSTFGAYYAPTGSRLVDSSQTVRSSVQVSYNADLLVSSKAVDGASTSYAYDRAQRVVSASGASSESFIYDPAGNPLGQGSPAAPWSYDANERLLSTGSAVYTYDANGNLASKVTGGMTTNYAYDSANRLVQVSDGSGHAVVTYGYDPFDRRVWKQMGGTRINYYYEDDGLAAEAAADGTIQTAYAYLPGSRYGTNPLFLRTAGNYYYYQNDPLGTPQRLSDAGGNIVWAASYTTFGSAAVSPASTVTNNLRFPGQYYDVETGLHYNFHRYYDPATARYLTPDPAGIAGGLNPYLYAKGNPTSYIDPTGEAAVQFVLVVLAVLLILCTIAWLSSKKGGLCGCTDFKESAIGKIFFGPDGPKPSAPGIHEYQPNVPKKKPSIFDF